ERLAELAADVVALLAPVEAVANGGTAARHGGEIDPELAQGAEAGSGDVVVGLTVPHCAVREQPAVQERGHQPDAELPGEMVVARACSSKRLRPRPLAERPNGLRRREARQRLERLVHLRPGEAEDATAAVPLP